MSFNGNSTYIRVADLAAVIKEVAARDNGTAIGIPTLLITFNIFQAEPARIHS
ncbi:MAG: hypothetical protein HWE13_09280 [Gammaproteobacteria bacterium]|nr:hypothetical protein [Gammaproteobacteria bacterium]NVK88307.1 hypothetical protein [Gammaproteobacteria bacterium]